MITAEVRWFFEEEISFDHLKQSLSFSDPSERVDYYLSGTGTRLGVKWREGNLEVKQQRGSALPLDFGRLSGEGEMWQKWSFSLDRKESYREMLATQPQPWVAVHKHRHKAGFAYDASQQKVHPLPEPSAEQGCDLEITVLTVAEQNYSTLGLEAFGPEPTLRQNLISTIGYLSENGNLEGLDLTGASSSSYARWLHFRSRYTTS